MKLRLAFSVILVVLLLAGSLIAQPGITPLVDQEVKITKSNFVPANGNVPPKADPQGTWSPKADKVDWRVVWDYGTKDAKGVFTPDNTIGLGGATLTLPDNMATGTRGPAGPEPLKNPLPANTYIRVQLQRRENGQWVPKEVKYLPIP